MRLWNDGRSGPAGCLAGNLVLAHLRDTEGEVFAERKGTTFEGRGKIWIGRMCSTDSYLFGRDRHWANLSLEQHRQVTHEAFLEGRSVKYLFVTALSGQPALHYWEIPGQVIERVAFSDPSMSPDFVYSLHIREDEHGHFCIENEDVSSYHRVLRLDAASSTRLESAFEEVRHRNDRRRSVKSNGNSMTDIRRPVAPAKPELSDSTQRRGFEIPLTGGRTAILDVLLPATEADLTRIKGWIDLMSDVLTESAQER